MYAIEITNLIKQYHQKEVLKVLTLNIKKGALFALLGPNGSGKSTLVKALTGIVKPESGSAYILGKSIIENSHDVKKITGVVPESLGLFTELTIWEHLILSCDVYGLDRDQTLYRAEQLLKRLDLWEYRSTLMRSGSYGMKKKCSFAMAIIHGPKVVFLDEPFEGIDPISSQAIKEILYLLVKNGVTVFLTSHIIDTVEKTVDSFAIIQDGKIVCDMSINDISATGTSLDQLYFETVGNQVDGDLKWLNN